MIGFDLILEVWHFTRKPKVKFSTNNRKGCTALSYTRKDHQDENIWGKTVSVPLDVDTEKHT